MAERDQPPVLLDAGEAAEPPARDVLEEDPLDGVLSAVAENLLQRRLDCVRHASDPAR
jgi:hypothetical protein